ncbi:hypothetical protein [Bacillus canaveralius]|uniref:hypothetical protein n=1 Tax=Bacillus canaveralius TaxID=1403243 RepID=UPI00163ACD3F|nr:hypothetical protein [Bacillus canaveralius]
MSGSWFIRGKVLFIREKVLFIREKVWFIRGNVWLSAKSPVYPRKVPFIREVTLLSKTL